MENQIISNNTLEEENTIPKNFEDLLNELNKLKSQITTIINYTKALDKHVKKELKQKDKNSKSKNQYLENLLDLLNQLKFLMNCVISYQYLKKVNWHVQM